MIKNVHVEHYKAFDKADVPIKPITILLGANSVGKSSIIHLLLAMEQTAMVDSESYTSCLKLFGGAVNMGSADNIFRRFETNIPVVLSFTICDKGLSKYFKECFDDHLDYYFRRMGSLYFFIDNRIEEQYKNLFEKKNSRRQPYNSITKKDYLSFPSNSITKNDYLSFIRTLQSKSKELKKSPFDDYFINQILNNNITKWEKLYDFLDGLNKLTSSDFEYKFKIKYDNSSTLLTIGFSLTCDGKVIFSYDDDGKNVNISSIFVKFDEKEKKGLMESFRNNRGSLFSCFRDKNRETYKPSQNTRDIISAHIIKIINEALLSLNNTFKSSKINHVSPLRANPKRYYMLDKANVTYSLDTFDGDAMAEVLKENKVIRDEVNKWLGNFKLSVDVTEIKEVIHHLKVKQNGLSLDITDVGFGISQLLPIIIQGFLSRTDSLTIIEQPEIHLHPKIQADLADLFIAIVKSNQEKELIIETHSEYLLRRLRRRISEGIISSDKVSICLFHPQTEDQGAKIEHLDIEEKGGFEWPKDFYDGELTEDITEFLKNQD